MGESENGNSKYSVLIKAFSVLALISVLAGVIVAHGLLSYAPQRPSEALVRAYVATTSIDETNAGERLTAACTVSFKDHPGTITVPAKDGSCMFESGDSIVLLSGSDGSLRLSPNYFAGEVLSLNLLLILCMSLFFGSLFAIGLFQWRSSYVMVEEVHSDIDLDNILR